MSPTPLATIYLNELRQRLDPWGVPLFKPDIAGIEVGTFGTFVGGRFDRKAHLRDRGYQPDVEDYPSGDFSYFSEKQVSWQGHASVPNPAGGSLAGGTLKFARGKGVVACFSRLVEYRVPDVERFDYDLTRLYWEGRIPPDRVVIFEMRQAATGTVIVSEEGNLSIEMQAQVPGGELSWAALGAGVAFTGGSIAGYQVSGIPMVAFVRLKRLVLETWRIEDIQRALPDDAPPTLELEEMTESMVLAPPTE